MEKLIPFGEIQTPNDPYLLQPKIATLAKNPEFQNPKDDPVLIGGEFVVFSTLSFLLSNALLLFFLGYLYSVTFDKHGMLLYLYRDVVKIMIAIDWLWWIVVMTCKFFRKGATLNEPEAKLFAYCFLALAEGFMLTLNTMGILRCCMSRQQMLDPPMPWDNEENDAIAPINKVRFTILLLTAWSIGLLYIGEIYPSAYFNLIGAHKSYLNLPLGTWIVSGLELISIIAYTIMSISSEKFKRGQPMDNEETFPRQLNSLLRACILLTGIFLISTIFIAYGNGILWIALQIVMTTGGVFVPGWMMLSVTPLKLYVGRRIENRFILALETLNCYIRYVYECRSCKKRSSAVTPIV